MALVYRAYFALSKTPRLTSAGLNTSAIMGFANTLLEVLRKEKPSHLAVVFDTAAPTARHLEFENYKAQRESMPEDLAASLPYVFKLLNGFKIPVITLDGFEADDIIGTLAKKAELEGFTTYCMTPDKDFAQLVSPSIFVYKPARMGNGAETMGVPEVLEKWEVEDPCQVIDILALWGDAVDNIPGIPGIGEKTAKLLIKKYGSVEGLIANSHELKGKQKENVEKYAEQARISKRLATILLDVPIPFSPEELVVEAADREILEPLFIELEFRTLGRRVFGEDFSITGSHPKGQMDLFNPPAELGNESNVAEPTGKNLNTTPHEYLIVDTPEKRKELADLLAKQNSFAFDTETTGLDPHQAELVGLSFSYEAGKAWYVPVPEERDRCIEILTDFKAVLEDPAIEKVGQNIKYDIVVLSWYGIQVQGKLFDTMIAHSLLDSDGRHNMDVLAENYLGYTTMPIVDLLGKKGKGQKSMREIPVELAAEYAGEDADITWQLSQVFRPLLKEAGAEKLAEEIEFPLIYVLAEMEKTGVFIDVDFLKEYSKKLEEELAAVEESIYKKAGTTFNIGSPKQLGEVLFDVLKLDPKAKKTKTGQYQTGEDVLLALASKSDIVKDILEYRQMKKLKSTYIDALPELINPNSKVIHTSFNQAVANTGRLSSTNPNLQNIPIKTARGKEVRKAFIPREKEYVLISADYSQIELRLVAAVSQEEGMMADFTNGLDIHTATAAKVYGVPFEEVTPDMRRNAKAVNFGIIYGQSAFGLSQSLGISRREAAEIIEEYFLQYPGIKDYMDEMKEFARVNGYVETVKKRRRYLRDINSANATVRGFAERNAINAPIQGSAAELIKIAMINIHNDIKELNLKGKMTTQVHDELVFDVPIEEVAIFKEIITNRMKTAIAMEVPLEVEIGVGENWLEAH